MVPDEASEVIYVQFVITGPESPGSLLPSSESGKVLTDSRLDNGSKSGNQELFRSWKVTLLGGEGSADRRYNTIKCAATAASAFLPQRKSAVTRDFCVSRVSLRGLLNASCIVICVIDSVRILFKYLYLFRNERHWMQIRGKPSEFFCWPFFLCWTDWVTVFAVSLSLSGTLPVSWFRPDMEQPTM